MKFEVHGIEFERSGICDQCGGCAKDCLKCPHGELHNDGSICTIYETRHLYCKECSKIHNEFITHQICIDFPNHPWLDVIRRGICSYKFERVDGKSMDTLPFVDGRFLK
jgi:hypothetical protein